MISKHTATSELRQDVVSGDWVVIATGRGKRPGDFLKRKRTVLRQSKSACPFESLEKERTHALYSLSDDPKKWWVRVVPNKYPALVQGAYVPPNRVGLYQRADGVGMHDLVITRDHARSIARMSEAEVELVVRAYQERYHAIKSADHVRYISIFHNHGYESGASVAHPHSQIIGLPVIPPDVGRSLNGSASYYHAHKKCVHCVVLAYELQAKERVIYENEFFVAIAPYASKTAFEARIFPKAHNAHFENSTPHDRVSFADALRVTLAKLWHGLENPDYNFFLHTAPTQEEKEFDHYHWHFEILPKTAVWAGFEIGTGIEISVIAPETAAQFLSKIKI